MGNFFSTTSISYYYSSVIAVIATLSGIAIPLGQQIVSTHLAPYKDKQVALYFTNECEYIGLKAVTLWLIPIFCVFYFTISWVIEPYIVMFSFILLIGYLYTFWAYVKKVFEYATNTDEVIFEKTKNSIDEYFK